MSIKHIADEITTLGAPPSDADLLLYSTRGLGPTYKELITTLQTRDSVVPFEELFNKIIDHETFLHSEKYNPDLISPTTNIAKNSCHLFTHLNLVFPFLPLVYSLILFSLFYLFTVLFVNTVTNAVMMLKNVSSYFLTFAHIAPLPIM